MPSDPPLSDIAGPSIDDTDVLHGCGPLTLGGFLLEVCRRYRDDEALVFDDALRRGATVRWTYGDLERESRGVARALIAVGVGRGSRVATLLGNRPEAVAAFFGAAMAGAVVTPLSTFSTEHELDHLLRASDASIILTQPSVANRPLASTVVGLVGTGTTARQIGRYPQLRHVVVLGDRHGCTAWPDFVAHGETVSDELVDAVVATTHPADPALVLFSSGSTATPKGMLHTHRAPTLQFWLQSRLFGRHRDTRMWTALPMFWTAGMNTAMGATLAAGGCWVMQEGFDPGLALSLLERERVTEPYTLPHQARALAEHEAWSSTDLSALRCVYGKSVFAKHPTVSGDPDWQMPVGWGMSETCAFISAHACDSGREAMRRSLGTLLPGNRLRVIDPDTGSTLPVGVEGEFVVKGPTLMARYLGKLRDECFDADGWFHTGDVGHVDEEGEVHWTGRRSEMIKTGGANVSPAEIEVQLRAHPGVKLARVVAMPDALLEQIAVLCVEPVDGESVGVDELQTFLRDRLAPYKVPKHVLFFKPGEIPMTANGTKVADDQLKARVADLMNGVTR
jgi:fatty-acyl-CoA synthase